MGARGAEGDDFQERVLGLAGGEDVERIAGQLGVMAGAGQGIAERPVALRWDEKADLRYGVST